MDVTDASLADLSSTGLSTNLSIDLSTDLSADLSTEPNSVWSSTEQPEQAVDISSKYTTRVVYFIIGTVGIVGNFIVILVLLSSRTLRTKIPNLYILSQSFIDLGTSVFLVSSSTITNNKVPYGGVAGQIYCQLWVTKVTLWGFLVSSTWNLVALTIERYLEVVHPIWHKMKFGTTEVVVSLSLAWGIGFVFNASYMIPTTELHADGQCAVYSKWPNDTTQKAIGVLTVVLQYVIPLIILIFCYSRIAMVIRRKIQPSQQPKPGMAASSGDNTGKQGQEHRWAKARRNTIKTLALVSACFVLCWSWNQVYYLMFNFGLPLNLSSDFYHFTVVAVFLNCCLNPVIYAIKYEQFQKQIKKLILKCPGCQVGLTIEHSVSEHVDTNIHSAN